MFPERKRRSSFGPRRNAVLLRSRPLGMQLSARELSRRGFSRLGAEAVRSARIRADLRRASISHGMTTMHKLRPQLPWNHNDAKLPLRKPLCFQIDAKKRGEGVILLSTQRRTGWCTVQNRAAHWRPAAARQRESKLLDGQEIER